MDIRVCIGSSCHLKGARDIINRLNYLLSINKLENLVELKGSFCMGDCICKGVSVKCNDVVYSVMSEDVDTFFKEVIIPSIPKAI